MLFSHKKFSPLMWTQFFGALNDNILKNAFVILLAFREVTLWNLNTPLLVTLATLVFILPFFLFSSLAGQIADKFEKSLVIQIVKLIEIFLMIAASVGLIFEFHGFLFLMLFLMGLQSTFFGPLKYSSIPQLVTPQELTQANGLVEAGTFVAILLGTIIGGVLISLPSGHLLVSVVVILVSILGYIISRKFQKIEVSNHLINIDLNIFKSTLSSIKLPKKYPKVNLAVYQISWFWLIGAILLSLLPIITTQSIGADSKVITYFLTLFTLGISIGAVTCSKISKAKPQLNLVFLGSLGLGISLLLLGLVIYFIKKNSFTLTLNLFLNSIDCLLISISILLITFFGGLYTVPLYTQLQKESPDQLRSQMIASNNIANAFYMVVGSVILMLLQKFEISIPNILFIFGFSHLLLSITFNLQKKFIY